MCQLCLVALELHFFQLKVVPLSWPLNHRFSSFLKGTPLLGEHCHCYLESWLEHLVKVLGAQGVNHLPFDIHKSRVRNRQSLIWHAKVRWEFLCNFRVDWRVPFLGLILISIIDGQHSVKVVQLENLADLLLLLPGYSQVGEDMSEFLDTFHVDFDYAWANVQDDF